MFQMSTFKLSNGTLRYLGAMLFFAAFAKPAMARLWFQGQEAVMC